MNKISSRYINIAGAILLLAGLYLTKLYNYLLFHGIIEVACVVVAFGIFMFAWNTRKYFYTPFFLFIGISYIYIGGLDILHTLSYKGMLIFEGYDYPANQLWIASRYLLSLTYVAAFGVFYYKRPKEYWFFIAYTLIFAAIIASVFYFRNFPPCFIEGKGQTQFKIISEYIISCILLLTIFLFYKHKDHFEGAVFRLLIWSIVVGISSEMAFTLYTDNYGITNMIGHYLKLVSYFLIYKAVIQIGLAKPFDIMFRDLKKSEDALKEANATKTKFFSIISHDLKNQFNNLIGFTGLLVEAESFDEVRKKRLINEIYETSKQLYDLSKNLLDWSTLQTDGMECIPETIDIHQLAAGNISLFKTAAELKKIRIHSNIEKNSLVRADRNMINLVIRNLLSNAIKFTKNGGEVIMNSKEAGRFMEVSVSDTGIGMDDKSIEGLFRTDVKRKTYGTANEEGTGIGLILCKEFVEKNGGRIWAESSSGQGCTFRFTVPKA